MKQNLLIFFLAWFQISYSQYNDYQIVYKDSLDPNLNKIANNFLAVDIDETDYVDVLAIRNTDEFTAEVGSFKQNQVNVFSNFSAITFTDNELEIEKLFYFDMNGDAKEDIIYINSANTINILSNQGSGNYNSADTTKINATENNRTYRINDIGDLDGDGDMDLVITIYKDMMYSALEDSSDLVLGWNDGNGNFDFEYMENEFSSAYYKVELGDFDGDDDLDLITVGFGYSPEFGIEVPWYQLPFFRWYKNDGDGNFGSPIELTLPERVERLPSVSDIHIADLEGDGDMDVFASFAIRDTCEDQIHAFGCAFIYVYGIWKYDETESDLMQISEVSSWPHDYLIESDFNYYENFFEPVYGDYNGDDNIDILSVNTITSNMFWRLGDGEGFFDDIVVVDDEIDLESIRPTLKAADMNNDGDLDVFSLINTDTISELRYYENNSASMNDQDNDGFLTGDDCDDLNENIGNSISTLIYDTELNICISNGVTFETENEIPNADYSWFGPNNYVSSLAEPSIESISVLNEGTYSVYTTLNHCISDTTEIDLSVLELPSIIIDNTDDFLTAVSDANMSSYQWYFNGDSIIQDGTNISYLPLVSGHYQVEVVFENECINTSDSIFVNIVGLNESVLHNFNLYPNPLKKGENLHIDFDYQIEFPLILSVVDLSGKLYYERKIYQSNIVLNDISFDSGTYYLEIKSASISAKKLIVILND